MTTGNSFRILAVIVVQHVSPVLCITTELQFSSQNSFRLCGVKDRESETKERVRQETRVVPVHANFM